MNEFEMAVRQRMIDAAKEDRERFFKVADTLVLQPKYKEKLEAIEELKQYWRDMTNLIDFPNVDFPFKLPEWFPSVHFASCWGKDVYINEQFLHNKQMEQAKEQIENVKQSEMEEV